MLPTRIVEGVFLSAEKRLVGMHAGAVDSENRLWHEGRVQAMLEGHMSHNETKSGHVVRSRKSVGVLEIDLVLRRSHLVMGGLDLETHCFESVHDVTPRVLTPVDGSEVEVAPRIMRLGGGTIRPSLK